jgi:acyl-CoA-dependent ceramide synthase
MIRTETSEDKLATQPAVVGAINQKALASSPPTPRRSSIVAGEVAVDAVEARERRASFQARLLQQQQQSKEAPTLAAVREAEDRDFVAPQPKARKAVAARPPKATAASAGGVGSRLADAWRLFAHYHPRLGFAYLATIVAMYFNPSTHATALPFLSLSYHDAASGLYSKGWGQDLKLVLTLMVVFILMRYTLITHVLRPLGTALGLSRSKTVRFTEQGTVLVFYTLSFVAGLMLLLPQPYAYDTDKWWDAYPVTMLTPAFKLYYLAALAFWCQFLITLHFETFRKDYLQTLSHHIITVLLVSVSYHTNFTRIGHSVLVYMDSADILLCLAKCLRYVGFQTLCNITFFLFTLVWIVTRHVFYAILLWSVAFRGLLFVDPAKADWEKGYYYSTSLHAFFFGLLASLQGLLIFWFVMIVKVLIKAIRGADANDDRGSDDEEEEQVYVFFCGFFYFYFFPLPSPFLPYSLAFGVLSKGKFACDFLIPFTPFFAIFRDG